jgi:hypothetical protein
MIHLNSRKLSSIDDYFNKLSVVPVSISYEKDPNDILKAKELYLTSLNNTYQKEKNEDLQSISDGITGQKGDVHLSIGSEMTFEDTNYNEVADAISEKIKSQYKIHSTNVAACIMQGISVKEITFTNEEIDSAMIYLKKRMHTIHDDMQPFFLSQYSNSVYKL